LIAPVPNFRETFATGLLKQADTMPDVLELVNIGPDFSLPVFLVDGSLAASGASGVELANHRTGRRVVRGRQFDKDATHFLDVFVGIDYVFVAQQEAKSQLAGLGLGFGTSVEGPIFRSQLLNRVASHPKAFFSIHFFPRIATARRGNTVMPGRTSGIMQLECRSNTPLKLPFSAMIAEIELLVMQAFASFSL